jgi:hypothetical protein
LEETSVAIRTTTALLIGALLVVGAAGLLAQTPKKQATYSVRGTVTGLLPGDSMVVYTGMPNGPSTTTQNDGTYVLPGFSSGKYTIMLSVSPYKVTPSQRMVAIVNSDVSGVDFQVQKVLQPGSNKSGPRSGAGK